jgi:hypothetical protein
MRERERERGEKAIVSARKYVNVRERAEGQLQLQLQLQLRECTSQVTYHHSTHLSRRRDGQEGGKDSKALTIENIVLALAITTS